MDLWKMVSVVYLVKGNRMDITWKFTNLGSYIAAVAYKANLKA
jgi:hypothetical protein